MRPAWPQVMDVRIGISGWRYAPWRGVFYPKGLPQKSELHYASERMRSIEINGSFYSLQRPSSYRQWYEETPRDFVFAVKGSRFITHMKKLRDCALPLDKFFGSGVFSLEHKLGPILWQLPPQLPFEAQRIEDFFCMLPRTTPERRPMRYAVEVRHESYDDPAFVRILRKHHIALVVADTAGKWPYLEVMTSDFVYVRLHGDTKIYVSGYSKKALDRWADRVSAWRDGGRDVYVYFDNDAKVRAPFDAMNLAARLGYSGATLSSASTGA